MVGVTAPDGWERDSSSDYRLDNDGRKFVYTHEEKGLEIFIEWMLEEEDVTQEEIEAGRGFSLWGMLRDDDGREIEGLKRFTFGGSETPKEDAIAWMESTMQQYA